MAALGPVPFAAMMMADMGAEIVTITPPPGRAASVPEERESHHNNPLWRGRSRLALDLKDGKARTALLGLIGRAEILLEGFHPGVMERLGLGPKTCLKANPSLVYERMSGWGQSGPLATTPGHDVSYLAITGALDAIGHPLRR